ncbi:MAG TPA: carboxypeptidase regulatory-like domain-containing protein, partial [Thermoanaerobaculia bacterium]
MNRRFQTALAALAAFTVAWPALAGSVSGRLLDPSGKPVAGAAVKWFAYRTDDQLLLDLTSGAEPAALGETKTGEDGRFRVALDKPGVAVALRVLPAGLPSIRLGGPYDSAEDSSLEDLHVASAELLTGRVVDDQGKPVAGASVTAVASDPYSDVDSQAIADAKSGPDGAFSIPTAPAAPRAVLVRVAGYVPATQVQLDAKPDLRVIVKRGGVIQGTVVDASGKPAAGAIVVSDDLAVQTDAAGTYRLVGVDTGLRAVEALWKDDFAARKDAVRVQRGAEAAVPLKLVRAATIAGTVVDETTRKPVAGVRVGASSGGFIFGGRRQRLERSARTDAQGKFRLTGLAPRAYTVSANREGFLSSSISGVTAGTSAPGSANLALAKAASIAGKVVDEKGAAMPGARVRLERDGGMRGMMRRGPAAFLGGQSALSGPDGAFRIRNLAAGRNLLLEAEKSGYTTGRRPGVNLK